MFETFVLFPISPALQSQRIQIVALCLCYRCMNTDINPGLFVNFCNLCGTMLFGIHAGAITYWPNDFAFVNVLVSAGFVCGTRLAHVVLDLGEDLSTNQCWNCLHVWLTHTQGRMAALATEAGVAAASTAAVGFGLFNYNRLDLKITARCAILPKQIVQSARWQRHEFGWGANYLYDAEFRYERLGIGERPFNSIYGICGSAFNKLLCVQGFSYRLHTNTMPGTFFLPKNWNTFWVNLEQSYARCQRFPHRSGVLLFSFMDFLCMAGSQQVESTPASSKISNLALEQPQGS